MNTKKAKLLRKEAIKRTVGRPMTLYEKNRPPQFEIIRNAFGMPIECIKVQRGMPRVLRNGCTRYVYKQLKRAA